MLLINNFLNRNLSKYLFCFYRNVVSTIKNVDLKYSYHNNFYKVSSHKDKIQIIVSEKSRSLRYYQGIKKQLYSLAEDYFLHEITYNNNDIRIDIGANIGEIGIYFKTLNKKMEYYGVEPAPSEYLCLKKNINSKNLYNIGIWNKKTELDFHLLSATADSSIFDTGIFTNIIKIKVDKLDNIINKKIKLMKVEAEGAEPEVLEGARNLLSNCQYVTIDCSPERSKKKLEVEENVKKIMTSCQFKLINKNNKRRILLFRNENI